MSVSICTQCCLQHSLSTDDPKQSSTLNSAVQSQVCQGNYANRVCISDSGTTSIHVHATLQSEQALVLREALSTAAQGSS